MPLTIWPSYLHWADKAVSIETRQQPDFCRDTYELPDGQHICMDAVMPRHALSRSYARAFLPSLQIPRSTSLREGGQVIEGYAEPGYGFPMWTEGDGCPDPLKAAYEYAWKSPRLP
jgi:hypothetical protein